MGHFVTVDAAGDITELFCDEPGYAAVPSGALPIVEDAGLLLRQSGFAGMALVADAVVESLSTVRAAKLNEMRAAYAAAISADIPFTTAGGVAKTFQADEASRLVLNQMIAARMKANTAPLGFYWVASDNTRVPFAFADMQDLAAAMGDRGWAAFQNLQNKKAAALAALTAADVQAVVW